MLVALLCAILLSACTRDPDDQKHKFFNKASELLKKGNTEAAALELQNALKIDPNYAEAGNILAEMRFRQGNPSEAYALLRRVLEGSPDYLPARRGLVQMYQVGGKFAEAQHEAEFILERSPDDIDALSGLATAQAAQKRSSEAEGTFNRILEIQPSHVNTLLALAALKQDAKDFPAAERFYKLALERNPRSIPVYMALIGFYMSTNRAPEADPLFADALKVSNNNVGILQVQISYYVDLGRLPEAENLVKKIQSSHLKDPKYWGALADFYVQVNQWDKAKIELERLVQLHDDDASVRKLVEVYLSLNDRKSAESLNEVVLKKNPKDGHAHLVKGRLYLADGEANNAVFQFNETKKYEPDLPALYYWYAQAHLKLGELEQAAQALDQALQFDPDYETARVELAELQNRMGAADVALSNAKRVLLKHPSDVRAMLAYSQALTATKDYSEADRVLKIVTQRIPTNAEAHRQLGVLNLVSKNLAAARKEFKEASSLRPGSKALLEEVLSGYVAEKQIDAAIEFLQKEIQGRPQDALLYHELAQVYLLQDKRAEAIPALKKALTLAPANPDSAVLLADVYITEKKPAEAVGLISLAMQKSPKDANLALRSAMILEKLGRWDEAQRTYQQVLQLDGENAVAKNNLASLLVDRGGNLDAALSLAQQAKEKLVNNLQVTNTIGWIYYKKNSYQTALKYLQECAEQDQKSATFQYQVGMTYWKLGRRDEAKQALQNALTLDRNLPEAEAVRNTLAQL